MRKSILSKISGYSSILNSVSPNTDQNLQILRISLKKEMDRKQKLQRLMEKYDQITNQQKGHIKSIKASIIQLKDLQSKCKTKFFLNPIIYVDNHLSKQTREYLCMLLNTFYSKYQENFQCEHKTKILNKEMNLLLESISKNEENLLKIQKQTIGVQVQLQGELLGHKTRLKDEGQRQKQLEQENKRISGICSQFQQRYRTQLNKVVKLRDTCKEIQEKISLLKAQVAQGQLIKKGKQQMMANEITYQEKFNIQLDGIDEEIKAQKEKQRLMKLKIKQRKLKVEQMKAKFDKISAKIPSQNDVNDQRNGYNLNKTSQIMQCSSTFSNNHLTLTQIKKYRQISEMMNFTFDVSKSSLLSSQEMKSKDSVSHEINMRIVQMKNQDSFTKNKQRISVR